MEGSGKTTLLNGLARRFREGGRQVLVTREPGGCELGLSLRRLLLDPAARIDEKAELFLFLADRAQHMAEVIRPALKRGEVVLCDRFADSTIVYQGYGRGLEIAALARLNALAVGSPWPDRTFVLDMEPEAALRRARRRNAESGAGASEGRFEAEDLAFHARIRQGFLAWAGENAARIRVLDASVPPDTLLETALAALPAAAFSQ